MKYILYLLLFLISANSFGQDARLLKFDCFSLAAVFEHRQVINHLQLNKVFESILIVDTFSVINCNDMNLKNIPLRIIHEYFDEIEHGDQSYRHVKNRKDRIIVLLGWEYVRNKLFLNFWQPQDNASIKISISGNNRVKVLQSGVF